MAELDDESDTIFFCSIESTRIKTEAAVCDLMDRAGCILNEKAFGNPWRDSRTSIRGIYDEESVDEAEREPSMGFLLSSDEISSIEDRYMGV